jgi:hypothetical protein
LYDPQLVSDQEFSRRQFFFKRTDRADGDNTVDAGTLAYKYSPKIDFRRQDTVARPWRARKATLALEHTCDDRFGGSPNGVLTLISRVSKGLIA